jgi:hypothetical protein
MDNTQHLGNRGAGRRGIAGSQDIEPRPELRGSMSMPSSSAHEGHNARVCTAGSGGSMKGRDGEDCPRLVGNVRGGETQLEGSGC